MRAKIAYAASFGPTAKNAEIGVGAPSYTSGRPHVEGRRRDLEEHAAADEDDPDDEEDGRLRRREGRRDARERERSRGAVDERDPVDEDARRERSEDEVLRGRLEGLRLALEIAREDVLRERHQLERDHDRGEVRSGGHEEHADRRKEDQAVVLAARVGRHADESQREQDRHDPDHEDRIALKYRPKRSIDEHAAECGSRKRSRQPRGHEQQEARHGEGADREEGEGALLRRGSRTSPRGGRPRRPSSGRAPAG